METIGSKRLVKRSEFIRIIIDALNSLGFHEIGAQLEKDSGTPLHSPNAKQFLEQVKAGEWDKSIATLQRFQLTDENPVKFLLLEQKFFEFLKMEKDMDALSVLREEMVPLGVNIKRVHELASKVISKDTESVNSRSNVVEKLQNLLPPGVIIPEKRLEYLLEDTLDRQRNSCTFHNVPDSDLSLFSDHHCWDHKYPSVTVQTLEEHEGEIWSVEFAHNGKYLASSSNDKTAIIWEMNAEGKFLLKHKLKGHGNPVVAVLWSPDDRHVITCGENEVIKRWEVVSGDCVHSYAKTGVGCVSCGWFHDGLGIIGGMEDRSISLWNLAGTEIKHLTSSASCGWFHGGLGIISDVAMTNDGKYIVSLGMEPNQISLFNRETQAVTLVPLFEAIDMITSFSLSKDGNCILVNFNTQKIFLCDIDEPQKCSEYSGHKCSRFTIRSCFGGYKESLIASGSEDSQVYIWKKGESTEPFRVLAGHSGVVNCVSWNPTYLDMLASGSDDGTIRIWGLDHERLK